MADITGCINKIRTSNSTEHYINAKYWDGHEWEELAGALKYCDITYADLKMLRDNGMLVSGQQYRITDYITTTTQANTQSEDNQFDVIVTADDENTLNEVARACLHEGDEYFSDAGANLEAWQIWYCLDNDTNRFNWADATNGKGVIYRMIDEWNNDCPYDFKNIMFIRYELNAPETLGYGDWVDQMAENIQAQFTAGSLPYIWGGLEDGEDRYWEDDYTELCSTQTGEYKAFYTFSNVISGVVTDKSITNYCYSNVIKEYISVNKIVLNNIVFFNTSNTTSCYYNSFGNGCRNNSFGNNCYSNSFGDSCYSNTFWNTCTNNSFGNFYESNSFGNGCSNNSFGNNCYSNSFGNYCYYNSFGNSCYSNSFGNTCNYNSFGNSCNYNSFGNSCNYNSFGNRCNSNSFGNTCQSNSFGNGCYGNKLLKSYTYYCHFDDGCRYINLTTSQTTSSNVKLQNVNVNRGVSGTSSSNITININTLNSEKEINVDNVNGYIYILDRPENIYENIYKTTYSNLVSIRDNSQLVPGMQYRITDYVTTTARADTQSAGHQFDVIVLATSESKLSENASAIAHEGDTYFSGADANLEAWQIWYCLDNDTNRFAWADEENGKGVIYRMIDEWYNDCPYDFKNIMFIRYELETPETLSDDDWVVQMAENIQTQFAAGSLPYIWGGLEDGEDRYWEDDNIELCSTQTGEYKAFYTFSNVISGVVTDKSITNNYCYNNVIKEYIGGNKIILNNIVFFNTSNTTSCYSNSFGNFCSSNSFGDSCNSNSFGNTCFYNSFGNGCYSNSFGNSCQYNSFGNSCRSNSFRNGCSSNSFGDTCYSNSFGDSCYSNSFEYSCYSNSFGNSCNSNSFGYYCYYNSFGNSYESNLFGSTCYSNSFGDSCRNNSFGNYCYYNSFGNNCYSNTFGNYYESNSFGNKCYSNTFGGSCRNNSFGNYCYSNTFGGSCEYNSFGNYCFGNSFGDSCRINSFGNGCYNNSFGGSCQDNSFVNYCHHNSFGNSCGSNTFGNNCLYISFGTNANTLKTYYRYNSFGDGCQYINLANNETASSSFYVQNYKFTQGLQGTYSSRKTITAVRNRGYETKVANNSDGDTIIYCEANLA